VHQADTGQLDFAALASNLWAMTVTLKPQTLTRAAFADFGDVIEMAEAEHYSINQGTTERYHDLADIDVSLEDGEPLINIFRGQPRARPIRLDLMERHPLGSQAFYPLQNRDWLLVVSVANDPCAPDGLKAFRATGIQGVNYARNVWHHPLLVLEPDSDFLIIDRGGPGNNLEERAFSDTAGVHLSV
jgi:ureidoglycolate lyase